MTSTNKITEQQRLAILGLKAMFMGLKINDETIQNIPKLSEHHPFGLTTEENIIFFGLPGYSNPSLEAMKAMIILARRLVNAQCSLSLLRIIKPEGSQGIYFEISYSFSHYMCRVTEDQVKEQLEGVFHLLSQVYDLSILEVVPDPGLDQEFLKKLGF